MKTKEIIKQVIIGTLIYAMIVIGLQKLVTDEFDLGSAISATVAFIILQWLFFAFGFKKFMKKYRDIRDILINSVHAVELTMDERLLLESPADYMKGIVAVGGKLSLTA